jgi:hypothetical protein
MARRFSLGLGTPRGMGPLGPLLGAETRMVLVIALPSVVSTVLPVRVTIPLVALNLSEVTIVLGIEFSMPVHFAILQ